MAASITPKRDVVRAPDHAGTWYDSSPEKLGKELSGYIEEAKNVEKPQEVIAAIGPHAGFMFCGKNMANAFKPFSSRPLRRIVVIGPSHHVTYDGCALTTAKFLRTPLGSLQVDTEAVAALQNTGKFAFLPLELDEAEHSIEMHLPMLQSVLGSDACEAVRVLPIVISRTSASTEAEFAKLLAPYCEGDDVAICLSSDFCHWGPRFQYTYLPEDAATSTAKLSDRIEKMDREGVSKIATGDPKQFRKYLKDTGNTICGQKPILVFMELANLLGWNCSYELVAYDRSSEHVDPEDSSVSYVACHIRKGAVSATPAAE